MTAPDTLAERYELIDRIAIGGMAEVYRAKAFGAHGFEKTLAIKRILPELAAEPEFEDRFIAEAKLAVALSHANIVQVMDFGRFAGSLFIAMEYVDGMDLAHLLKFLSKQERLVPVPAAFQIAIEICRGLDFAHKHEVIHRDVSPSNILLSRAGEVKVADFGIAQAVTKRSSQGGWKKIMGKWRYMSPEQTRGDALTTQSDVFSLASMLFELFTGTKLFPGDDAETIAHNIDSMTIPSASAMREGLPERFDEVLLSALERRPEDRTRTAELIQRQLTELCYEYAILATPLDVAELVSEIADEAEGEAASKREAAVAGVDDLIRAQLLEGIAAPEPTRQTAVGDEQDDDEHDRPRITEVDELGDERHTQVTGAAPAIVRKKGDDGITVWELDRETIAAAPAARRRRTGSLSAITDAITGTDIGGSSGSRVRGILIGLLVAGAALAAVLYVAFRDDQGQQPVVTASDAGPAPAADARAEPAVRATLRIDSMPPGASVDLDGRRLPEPTPTSVQVEAGVASKVLLTLEGYEPWEDPAVQVPRGETLRIRPRLVKWVAELEVSTRPDGVTVVLDGKQLGTSPLSRADLEPGNRVLTLRKDGFKPQTIKVQLRPGSPIRIERTLRSSAVLGTINLQIDDGWAEVYLRGKKIGRAPVRGLQLPVGKHRLRLYNPRSKKQQFLDVEVVTGETRYYRTRL